MLAQNGRRKGEGHNSARLAGSTARKLRGRGKPGRQRHRFMNTSNDTSANVSVSTRHAGAFAVFFFNAADTEMRWQR